jgi:hypothetical protein
MAGLQLVLRWRRLDTAAADSARSYAAVHYCCCVGVVYRYLIASSKPDVMIKPEFIPCLLVPVTVEFQVSGLFPLSEG